MNTLAQVKAEKRVILTQRIHKIVQLSIHASGAGIAHCFADYSGHVDRFDAHIQPADQSYKKGSEHIDLAKVNVRLEPTGDDLPEIEGWFVTNLAKLDQYIAYLDHVVALGKPILTEHVGGAA